MNETSRYLKVPVLALALLVFGAVACSETWEGAKEDTKENVDSTGKGMEKAGENIQKQVQ